MAEAKVVVEDSATGERRVVRPTGETVYPGNTSVQLLIVDPVGAVTVSNGKHYMRINTLLSGQTLKSIKGSLTKAGAGSGSTTVQIVRLRGDTEKSTELGTNVLSTELTFGVGSFEGSSAVIQTGGVLEADLYRFDVLTETSTPGKGLIIDLEYG